MTESLLLKIVVAAIAVWGLSLRLLALKYKNPSVRLTSLNPKLWGLAGWAGEYYEQPGRTMMRIGTLMILFFCLVAIIVRLA